MRDITSTATTEDNISTVGFMMQTDKRVTYQSIFGRQRRLLRQYINVLKIYGDRLSACSARCLKGIVSRRDNSATLSVFAGSVSRECKQQPPVARTATFDFPLTSSSGLRL
ncbi:hypothetical protein EVAR_53946_1 [Eumeta japonica]|uniref:Uncharacterized protein n=1 Tax=Eumeta variegata TaxID=151549 RepID=A0A4C1ZD81_EUMVA|nr:hypothetical protein EVAR_53946_1 [Eumeta japonica]